MKIKIQQNKSAMGLGEMGLGEMGLGFEVGEEDDESGR